jgi:hypothetical protein
MDSILDSSNQSNHISEKSKAATVFIALFVGHLGMHRYYIGKIKTARFMLIISIFSFYGLYWMIFHKSLPTEIATKGSGSIEILTALVIIGLITLFALVVWAWVDIIITLLDKMKDKNGLHIKR